MFKGSIMVDRFSRDVVISKILSIVVFRYLLFIRFIGRVLKNIIVPRIDIRLLILFFILVDSNINMFCLLLGLYIMFLGFIRRDNMILDKMLVNSNNKAILWLKIAFK
jgi:hypothetical protein